MKKPSVVSCTLPAILDSKSCTKYQVLVKLRFPTRKHGMSFVSESMANLGICGKEVNWCPVFYLHKFTMQEFPNAIRFVYVPELRAHVPCDLARTTSMSLPLPKQQNNDEVSTVWRVERGIWVHNRQNQKRTGTRHSFR